MKKSMQKLVKFLHDGMQDTATNLLDGAQGEHYESEDMYVGFAGLAEEGFADIAFS